jgi:hypothetical protein
MQNWPANCRPVLICFCLFPEIDPTCSLRLARVAYPKGAKGTAQALTAGVTFLLQTIFPLQTSQSEDGSICSLNPAVGMKSPPGPVLSEGEVTAARAKDSTMSYFSVEVFMNRPDIRCMKKPTPIPTSKPVAMPAAPYLIFVKIFLKL